MSYTGACGHPVTKKGYKNCRACYSTSTRYCKWGHDTEEVGRSRGSGRCKQCGRDASRVFTAKRRQDETYLEHHRQYRLQYRRRLKGEVIVAYGGHCVCCGETRPGLLTIDHVNGGGHRLRREGKERGGLSFYIDLRRNGFPQDDYRLLCYNCNCSRDYEGMCPHEEERLSAPL